MILGCQLLTNCWLVIIHHLFFFGSCLAPLWFVSHICRFLSAPEVVSSSHGTKSQNRLRILKWHPSTSKGQVHNPAFHSVRVPLCKYGRTEIDRVQQTYLQTYHMVFHSIRRCHGQRQRQQQQQQQQQQHNFTMVSVHNG